MFLISKCQNYIFINAHIFFIFIPLHIFYSSFPLPYEDSHPDSPLSHPYSPHFHLCSPHSHPDSPHFHPDSPYPHPCSPHFYPDSPHSHYSHPDSPHSHYSPHSVSWFSIPAFTMAFCEIDELKCLINERYKNQLHLFQPIFFSPITPTVLKNVFHGKWTFPLS